MVSGDMKCMRVSPNKPLNTSLLSTNAKRELVTKIKKTLSISNSENSLQPDIHPLMLRHYIIVLFTLLSQSEGVFGGKIGGSSLVADSRYVTVNHVFFYIYPKNLCCCGNVANCDYLYVVLRGI